MRQVQAASSGGGFEDVDHAQTLLVVAKSIDGNFVEDGFSCVTEGCMSQVMTKGDSLGKVFVQK